MKRIQVIKVRNYDEDRINRLAVVVDRFEAMETDKERRMALDWLESKYHYCTLADQGKG